MKSPLVPVPVLLLIGTMLLGGIALPQAPATTEELIRQSHFIFEGQIEKTAASNLTILPASERTAVVRVISVLYAEPGMMNFANQEVTIQFVRGSSMKPGEQAIFFTNGWLYGENLAVTENAHVPVGSLEAVQKAIPNVTKKLADAPLQTRLMQAAVVVTGRVVSVKSLQPGEPGRGPRSEHDPDWWVAEIETESVLKGVVTGSHITVVFPHSNDRMWFSAPKFRTGETGVWLLQQPKQLAGIAAQQVPSVYTALDPLDFQSQSSLERVRVLVKGVR